MSRDLPPDDDREPDDPRSSGTMRPTGPGVLVAAGVAGLVLGWLWRPVATNLGGTAPLVTWIQVATVFFIAAALSALARATWVDVQQRHRRLPAHQAVNRLLIAKASAVTGAVLAGGYAGYAVAFIGLGEAALAGERMGMSAVAALAGLLVVAAALVLERACRTPEDGARDLP